jgi:hypothetical protein
MIVLFCVAPRGSSYDEPRRERQRKEGGQGQTLEEDFAEVAMNLGIASVSGTCFRRPATVARAGIRRGPNARKRGETHAKTASVKVLRHEPEGPVRAMSWMILAGGVGVVSCDFSATGH